MVGAGDRRDTSYRKSWEQRQEGQFSGSSGRRDTSYRRDGVITHIALLE